MNYHWNWPIFGTLSPDGIHTYLGTFWLGLQWTLATALLAWCLALLLGIGVGCLRTVPRRPLVLLSNAYIEVFRNIPLLVQMFLWYFVVPELLPRGAGDWLKALPNAPFVTATLCLGCYTSARVAVQVAAGIDGLPRGQRQAATALGLSGWQTYRHVLLPVALRTILPPLTSELVNVVKNSAVALTIGLMELTAQARSMQEMSFQVFEAFTGATVLYLLVNGAVVTLMAWVERRAAVPGLHAVGRREPA